MTRLLLSILALSFVIAASPAPAQISASGQEVTQRSAFTQGRPAAGQGVQAVPQAAPGGETGWWQWLLDTQRDMQHQLAEAVRGLKTGDTFSAGLFLVMVSFVYGVLHAAGPGHGKAVISSYVLANKATLRRGVVLSMLAGVLQAISAITIVGVTSIVLKTVLGIKTSQVQNMVIHRFEMVSSLMIAAAGLWLLTVHLRRHYQAHRRRIPLNSLSAAVVHHDHDHGENCTCGKTHIPDAAALEQHLSLRQAATIVFAVGIRPCTGAILVLVFALTQGMIWAGIASTFVMAMGTAITVAGLASLAVGSREMAVRFAGSRWTDGIYNFAAITGCVLVMLIGIGLFWETLGPPQPF